MGLIAILVSAFISFNGPLNPADPPDSIGLWLMSHGMRASAIRRRISNYAVEVSGLRPDSTGWSHSFESTNDSAFRKRDAAYRHVDRRVYTRGRGVQWVASLRLDPLLNFEILRPARRSHIVKYPRRWEGRGKDKGGRWSDETVGKRRNREPRRELSFNLLLPKLLPGARSCGQRESAVSPVLKFKFATFA